ncbi:sugar ABC transporter ATP-binding protein [Faecalicatena contorta]|uniref:sugar ABC transporter ATP-binding protein n=2 Tax=Faecalicatena contorta TaxID=39482 RepID=UPI00129DB980|nr:sugar ABC transporter ATP-binding protein [Faecalicatena contorta]MBS6762713.1 sugar ABC transporter ATP-binding protein [Clostridium sp.]MEE0199031.1 sugar ABC transporter ATP-binding protein [Muricomes sp.]MRM88773.1 sugar ABC transporter ATP-binding protein [Faecalicatena contorta]
MMEQKILELRHITKLYPGVVALDDVSLGFSRGEVHAIVGENGAGKSTFIKVITGAIAPTQGTLIFEGKQIEDNTPQKSMALGITAIYQELNLLKHLSVAENIYYNRYRKKRGLIDFRGMEEDAAKVLERLGVKIDPKMLVKDLSVGYQQLVEIAKSLSQDVKVMIMDEPSAALTNSELQYLFEIVKTLKQEGMAILYISHRMEEIFQLCDKVSVFRDGHYIKTMDVKDTTQEELIRLMVNRELNDTFPEFIPDRGEKVLEVQNVCTELLKDVSFEAYRGERLGFAGLVGAGRTETARAVYGADKMQKGEIRIKGRPVNIQSPEDAIKHGIALIPEDRKQQGLFLNMSVKDNISFVYAPRITNVLGLINRNKEEEACRQQIEKLTVKTPTMRQLVKNLSGGNQQKVILGKWLLMNCDIIIFDEPTRGIDVGAKQEIYELINELARQGKAVILISSELPELMGMSDRVIVMAEGRISGELKKEQIHQEKILELASKAQEVMS